MKHLLSDHLLAAHGFAIASRQTISAGTLALRLEFDGIARIIGGVVPDPLTGAGNWRAAQGCKEARRTREAIGFCLVVVCQHLTPIRPRSHIKI